MCDVISAVVEFMVGGQTIGPLVVCVVKEGEAFLREAGG
jgi:hypothetical protein